MKNFGRSLLRTHYGIECDLAGYEICGEVWIFDLLPSTEPYRAGPYSILEAFDTEEIRVGDLQVKEDLLKEALEKIKSLEFHSLKDQYLQGQSQGAFLFEKIYKDLGVDNPYESTPQVYKSTESTGGGPLRTSDQILIDFLQYRSGPNLRHKKLSIEVLETVRGALEEGVITESRLEYLKTLVSKEEAFDWPQVKLGPVAIIREGEERPHTPLRELLHDVADLFDPKSTEIHFGHLRETYAEATRYLGLDWPLEDAVPSRYVTFKGLVVDLPSFPLKIEGVEIPLSGQTFESLSLEELKALEVYFNRTTLPPSKNLDLCRGRLIELIAGREGTLEK